MVFTSKCIVGLPVLLALDGSIDLVKDDLFFVKINWNFFKSESTGQEVTKRHYL